MTGADPAEPRSSWSTEAMRTFDAILEAQPNLNPSVLAGLYQACDFLAAADAMQRRVNADGVVAEGSQGQPVAHPLIAEVRHYRREAVAILRTLGLTSRSPASAAASALANKRWGSRPAGLAANAFVGVRPMARERYTDEPTPFQEAP